MPYLWAVCQESLRMYPPVPITNRVAKEDDEWVVNGKKCRIPKVQARMCVCVWVFAACVCVCVCVCACRCVMGVACGCVCYTACI